MTKPDERDDEKIAEEKNFLARWSRRKREAEQDASAASATDEPVARDPRTATPSAAPAAPFDVASLPAIDSIGPQTDIRGFLNPGVPPELTRAALRRAWSVDPSIRDYIGPSENAWDFNDPNAMGGFGPLAPDAARQLLAGLFGDATPAAEASAVTTDPVKSEPLPEESAPPVESRNEQPPVESASLQSPATSDVAPQQEARPKPDAPAHHRAAHGGALPR